MRKARYICIEGCEGVGKTTQVKKLVDHLRAKGYKVLATKEPGSEHSPLTMELRNIMLNAKFNDELTAVGRELVSQAIRSIHLEKVVVPAIDQYDFIIQDRGVLSGFAYGEACGHNLEWLEDISYRVVPLDVFEDPYLMYDDVVYLTGSVAGGLSRALSSKKEFEDGDAMELKGISFMETVSANMNEGAEMFAAKEIAVDGKSIDEVFTSILKALDLEQ